MAVQSRWKAAASGDSVGTTKETMPAKIQDTGRVLGFLQQYFAVVLVVMAIAATCASEWLEEKTRFSSTVVCVFGALLAVVALLFHELRPVKNNDTITFDPKCVEVRKQEIAEMERKHAAETQKKGH